MKILIVDDEDDIRLLIKFHLERAGYRTTCAATAQSALDAMRAGDVGMVILDLMLPDMSGLDVCRALKQDENTAAIPIVMVTARTEDDDIVKGLELGADDYITKPFSPKVLTARVKSVLRRRAAKEEANDSALVSCGSLTIDTTRHEAAINGKTMNLSATEFAILLHLARHAGQVFSRRQIIDAIKGDDYPVTERSVDVQILSIRRKMRCTECFDKTQQSPVEMSAIVRDSTSEGLIETIRGVGYRMRDES